MKLTDDREVTFLVEERQGRRHFVPVECELDEDWRRPWFDAVAGAQAKDFDVPFSTVLRGVQQLCLFVDIDPEVLGGTPKVKDTRIPIYGILQAIEEYGSVEGATKAYRALSPDMVRDALRFAARVLEFPGEHDDQDFD